MSPAATAPAPLERGDRRDRRRRRRRGSERGRASRRDRPGRAAPSRRRGRRGAGAAAARRALGRAPRGAVVVPGAVDAAPQRRGAIAAYAALPADVRGPTGWCSGRGRRTRQHLRLRRIARSAGVSVVTTVGHVPACLRARVGRAVPELLGRLRAGCRRGAVVRRADRRVNDLRGGGDRRRSRAALRPTRRAESESRARASAGSQPTSAGTEPPADTGAALRAIWERVGAGREVLQPPNLLPSDSDRTA